VIAYDINGQIIQERWLEEAPGTFVRNPGPTKTMVLQAEGIASFEVFHDRPGPGVTQSIQLDNIEWAPQSGRSLEVFAQDNEDSAALIDDWDLNTDTVSEPKVTADGRDFTAETVAAIESSDVIKGDEKMNALIITGQDQIIDLTRLGNKLESIEVIDITGSGNNTLNISLGDILVQGDTNLFIHDDTVQMMVKGNAGDVVNLSDLVKGSDEGDWAKAEGTVEVAGVKYEVYQHSALDAELLVQEGIQTNLLNN
jgi:hypothetical protein